MVYELYTLLFKRDSERGFYGSLLKSWVERVLRLSDLLAKGTYYKDGNAALTNTLQHSNVMILWLYTFSIYIAFPTYESIWIHIHILRIRFYVLMDTISADHIQAVLPHRHCFAIGKCSPSHVNIVCCSTDCLEVVFPKALMFSSSASHGPNA